MSAISILPASADLLAVIDRWHAFMGGADPDALDELLHDHVLLYSPVVFTPPRGKAVVATYLAAAKGDVRGGRFRCAVGSVVPLRQARRLRRHRDAGVRDRDGRQVRQRRRHIRVDDSGRIVEFRVMVRPLQAVNAVHRLMGAELAAIEARS